MKDATVASVDQAKGILTRLAASSDPAVSIALAQGWALLAIAEQLEEFAQATRQAKLNPLALNAVPFASKPTGARPTPNLAPAFPTTPTIIVKKRRPIVILRGTAQTPTVED